MNREIHHKADELRGKIRKYTAYHNGLKAYKSTTVCFKIGGSESGYLEIPTEDSKDCIKVMKKFVKDKLDKAQKEYDKL